ncbi:MAG: hypothetical protein K2L55_04190 [Muribaculaceae bacterium]|nr:hypothetical protein [Muribaculaceae bacterium]
MKIVLETIYAAVFNAGVHLFYGLGAIHAVIEFCAARAGAVCVWLFCSVFLGRKIAEIGHLWRSKRKKSQKQRKIIGKSLVI